MAAGLYQCTALQSRARPADRLGSHYRNGFGVVSLSQNLAEETQRVIHGGAPFHSASASPTGYAPAERNSVLSTLTSLGVGQIKPPKWARPTCQKQKVFRRNSPCFTRRLIVSAFCIRYMVVLLARSSCINQLLGSGSWRSEPDWFQPRSCCTTCPG